MKMGPPAPYFCIQCGRSAPQVYKTYANGNLIKMLPCKGCKELIDKYVEYDPIIVVINLVLQNPMAYRHILLNSAFVAYWKLGIVFLFCEAYCYWCFQKGVEYETVDFYELEINFYRVLLRTLFSSGVFHLLVLMTCFIRGQMFSKEVPSQFSYLVVWKGLCMSGFSEIFELIALIWSYTHDEIRFLFVSCLYVCTNVQCYHVCTGVSRIKSLVIISTCFLLRKHLLGCYDSLVKT